MGTTSQKLTYLNDTKTQLKGMINYGLDTGEKITSETTFRNYVKSLFDAFIKTMTYPDVLYNNLPKVTGEGTSLTLNDTVYAPMRVELSPSALEQKTTTGKNLCFAAEYESSNTARFRINKSKLQQNFVLSYISDVTAPNGAIYLFTDGTNRGALGVSIEQTANIRKSVNISINNTNWDYIQSATYVWITSYAVNSGHTSGTIVKEAQIENGSSMTSYEEYTGGIPAPNPDYPQTVHTVSGENTITIENKNLLNRENCIEDGILAWANGTPVYGSTYENSLISNYIRVELNQTYSFNHSASMFFYDKNKNYLGALQNNNTTIAKNSGKVATGLTIPNISEIYYMRLSIRASSTSPDYTTIDIMVNKGTTLLNYVPHQEQSLPLSLADLEYCKIGDYEDLFFKNVVGSEYYNSTLVEDKWYLKKNVGKVVLDGSEDSWVNDGDGAPYKYVISDIKKPPSNAYTEVLCDNYYPVPYNDNWNNYDYLISRPIYTSTIQGVKFRNKDISSLNDFKTWLSTHNTSVYYILKTPTYTPLSDTLQTQLEAIWRANSYEEQTNISQTNNDLPFVLSLSAIRDLSGIFEEI